MRRCGRELTSEELDSAVDVVSTCGGLSRKELARTICEHLGWVTVTGRYKESACLGLLEELERSGRLKLPGLKPHVRRPRPVREGWDEQTEPQLLEGASLEAIGPVELELVGGSDGNRLWNVSLQQRCVAKKRCDGSAGKTTWRGSYRVGVGGDAEKRPLRADRSGR